MFVSRCSQSVLVLVSSQMRVRRTAATPVPSDAAVGELYAE